MRDGQYGSGKLIDVTAVSLRNLHEMDSAALREVLTSCLTDDKEQMARFSSSI
ncbi:MULTISPECIES: hypothetical protein [unclassified Nonomuraea]|uniref:hypothetical protein n=1 Tax=unclassified Nonomuraea TaxID=2593643 RepID=UPI0032DBC9A2